jgi:tRNA-uridine 2-sulfurtransferase
MIKKKTKALIIFSGGLDSILAALVLMDQGIAVEGIGFKSNFYDCEKALKSAKEIGIKLHLKDISKAILALVKNPSYGYGKNLNPCIDCHAMMIKLADKFAKRKFKTDNYIIASGEVLGQRPFSQNKQALGKVIKISGVEVLRPLSARLLPETEVEKRKLVDRLKLGIIQGRTREAQINLARQFGLKTYPSPAGGCLLTDPEFSQRVKKMLEYWPKCKSDDLELLKYGRTFWQKLETGNWSLIVVGRNKEDNEKLARLAKNGDVMVELKEMTGPLTLVRIFKFPISNFQ